MKKNYLEYILVELLKGEFISGEEVAKSLHISRTWVWNQINLLKEMGFKIISHKKGYKLVSSPDLLIPPLITHHLHTEFIGRQIYFFEELTSTQDMAKQLAEEGKHEGTLIISEIQKRGRGRQKRKWIHIPKKSLGFSLILRPKLSPMEVCKLPLVAGVAICESINKNTRVQSQLKWPNDVIIENKKVAGILAEMSGDPDTVHYVVLGIGINVNLDEEDIPYDLKEIATSIYLKTKSLQKRSYLLANILNSFEYWYKKYIQDGFKQIRKKWIELNNTLNKDVTVIFKDQKIYGRAIDIDDNGNLIVVDENNNHHKVMYGDVSIRTKT